ncbi:MAG: tetraacyldisaccharide 4'-kinase, partial [Acetobacteraceae bacterium]|nr:tetraacyldisaccharide 4'-kinase [Acetobacteraceae bacterium]
YREVVRLRNRLYDQGSLHSRRLAGPVISVGSISVGGAGKTPFVIYLGELLRQRGIACDVLSRGYGRKTRGELVVRSQGSARDFGDEPVLIAQSLGCPVVVGASRYRAGQRAEELFGPELHLLDDGYQHRGLARDFDIVLLTPEDLTDRLLPAGRLREPPASLARADAVVLFGQIDSDRLPLAGQLVWRAQRSLSVTEPPRRALVFCGIARPQGFIQQLREASIDVLAHRFYPDHHPYSDQDVRRLIEWQKQAGGEGFITTEKDVINLGQRLGELGRVAVARVVITLANPADVLDTIVRVLRERRPTHEKILLSSHSQ